MTQSQHRFTDVAHDPCAIIARSSCGTVAFFACYGLLAFSDSAPHLAFWLSLCIGLIGCLVPGKTDLRFIRLMTAIVMPAVGFAAMAIVRWS